MKIQRFIQFLFVLTLLVGAIGSVAKSLAPAQVTMAAQPTTSQEMAATGGGGLALPDAWKTDTCRVGWNS